ncbi:uncharacterized protein Z520_03317 [Fonsecaea multimorphosa CBS 102226]|uniref:Histidinol-phosphatase n=1 Tax=Fonsecaea multimorphosa CBS 102226 TaxID=1442371 RepID=A0A0D2K4A3_9EURO|nr:uncharacterized protein Z520_03317 [Fonsecaea multimorphosa CBS 102226]KIY00653.1 hypothetical protein Z520_03317 [Fonsecaea multimorphosa CBS 102226]OAL19042.1 hypothetical protein AYO22_10371 [Fonsecaea multimorphosa]
MPFSHHSHSGQFCADHARDSLDDVIQTAMAKGMAVFALTEHMPRHEQDRYPGETATLEMHYANEAAYVAEALRLRQKYKDRIGLPLGFEGEWIRPESEDLIKRSLETHPYDFFIGSVHHVHTIPIDYDHAMYKEARSKAGGTDERIFEDYFDAQFAMLQTLRPPVVGHFDLIRLKSDDPNQSFKPMRGVWARISRNLDCVAEYGGILEINSAAVRKGMDEPYPKAEICEAALERGIRFCLSDDSHGVDQVAHSYPRVLELLEKVGIKSVTFLSHREREAGAAQPSPVHDHHFPTLYTEQIGLKELREHRFWGQ